MGSHEFEDFYRSKTATMQQAYAAQVEQALIEHGNDPYNGTITTTEGVVNGALDPRKLHTIDEAQQIMHERIEALHKWGPCEALRLMDLEDAPRRTVRKTVTLRQSPSDFRNWHAELEAAARSLVTARAGEEYERMRIVQENYREKVTRKYQIALDTPREKSETRYFITGSERPGNARVWAQGYATQAAARAALIDQLNTMSTDNVFSSPSSTYEIVGETRRTSGAGLVKATRRVVSITAEVDVTFYKMPTNPQQGGWLFYGWAAS